MPVKIRLMRIGSKKRPFYRVVAVDEKKKRTGQYIEALGTYNPLTEPHEIILKKDRIDFWLSQGAIPSYGYLRVIKEAPQKPPRKPKREQPLKKEEAAQPEGKSQKDSENSTDQKQPENQNASKPEKSGSSENDQPSAQNS